MWLRSTSEVEVDRRIALLVRRSRGAHRRLRESRAVRYSSDLPVDRPKPHDSSHAVAPTTGSNPTRPANEQPLCRPEGPPSVPSRPEGLPRLPLLATLMEFPSPSTLEPRRVHSTPACLTGYVPSTGFRTLSTVCSSPGRPALFHAGNAHGVFRPPGVFPHRQVHQLVAAGLPSWRFSTASTYCRCAAPASARRNVLHGPFPPPGRCSDGESVPSPGCYTVGNDRSPLELLRLSRVLPYTHRPRRMQRVPLWRFAPPKSVFVRSSANPATFL
jgi:hypothetical protein